MNAMRGHPRLIIPFSLVVGAYFVLPIGLAIARNWAISDFEMPYNVIAEQPDWESHALNFQNQPHIKKNRTRYIVTNTKENTFIAL